MGPYLWLVGAHFVMPQDANPNRNNMAHDAGSRYSGWYTWFLFAISNDEGIEISPMALWLIVSLQWLSESKLLLKEKNIPHSGVKGMCFHFGIPICIPEIENTSVICWLCAWHVFMHPFGLRNGSGSWWCLRRSNEAMRNWMGRISGMDNNRWSGWRNVEKHRHNSWFLGVACVGYVGAGVL